MVKYICFRTHINWHSLVLLPCPMLGSAILNWHAYCFFLGLPLVLFCHAILQFLILLMLLFRAAHGYLIFIYFICAGCWVCWHCITAVPNEMQTKSAHSLLKIKKSSFCKKDISSLQINNPTFIKKRNYSVGCY